jgi:hypothetical protein
LSECSYCIYNFEIGHGCGAKPLFSYQHGCVFAAGHAINYRDRLHAYEGLIGLFEDGPIDIKTIGIGPIEDYELLMIFGTCFEAILQGRDVGIESYANVLQIV